MLQQMYRLPDVIKVTGLSRSSIYLAISKNQFPKPIKIPFYTRCHQFLWENCGLAASPILVWLVDPSMHIAIGYNFVGHLFRTHLDYIQCLGAIQLHLMGI